MKIKLQSSIEKSTTRLGDWYALDLVLDRQQFILCVSSASRLAVVMNAAPYASFPDRLADAVSEVLRAIGVSEPKIQDERAQMEQIILGKTVSKSILGTLSEDRFQLEACSNFGHPNFKNTFDMSLYLSKTISLAIPEGYPEDAALKCFNQPPRVRAQMKSQE
jgi:hypothetical protein